MFSTLRARLTLWHLVALLTTLGLFASLLYAVLANSLHHHHDDELAEQAAAVTGYLRGREVSDATMLEAVRLARVSSRFVMIRGHDGDLRFREPALQATEPNIGRHAVLTHVAMARPAAPEFFTVELEQSGAVRFICVPLAQAELFLQIGDPIGDVRTALDTVRDASLTLIPVVLLVSSLGSWLLAKRALQPVRAMDATLRDIEARDLSRRVHVEARDREIAGLVATVNQLLDRLQRAFSSLQQFAGDVSHQLQTPLTVMKSSIESQQRDRDLAPSETFAELGEQIDSMSATIRELRALAVADAPVDGAPFDFSAAVEETADIVAALGEMKQVRVRHQIAPNVQIAGDPIRLKQVVLNLGENAVKYTLAGGQVGITLTADARTAVLRVRDTGLGIAAEEQRRIFDRAYRGKSLTHDQGSGLGLAIAKRIVDAHRGQLEVDSQPSQGATFTVTLPLS
jgi:signal transduction histidine kinase